LIGGKALDEAEGNRVIFGEWSEFILTPHEKILEILFFRFDEFGDAIPSISGIHPEFELVGGISDSGSGVFKPLTIIGEVGNATIAIGIILEDEERDFGSHGYYSIVVWGLSSAFEASIDCGNSTFAIATFNAIVISKLEGRKLIGDIFKPLIGWTPSGEESDLDGAGSGFNGASVVVGPLSTPISHAPTIPILFAGVKGFLLRSEIATEHGFGHGDSLMEAEGAFLMIFTVPLSLEGSHEGIPILFRAGDDEMVGAVVRHWVFPYEGLVY
jgi:hypothetical protein